MIIIEHSVIDLSGLPRRTVSQATDDILWGVLWLDPDSGKPLIDLREVSQPGTRRCHYVIASRMYRPNDSYERG